MKKIFLLFSLFISFGVSAQDYYTFKGRVLDQYDSLPIYNCNIYVQGEGIGTISNLDGFFKLIFPSKHLDKKLVVSFISYESYQIYASEAIKTDLIIYLNQKTEVLDEVTIRSIDAKGVLEKAIAKISDNYPQTKSTYDVFYKEIGKINNNYYRFQEVAASLYSEGFSQKHIGRKDYPSWIHGKRSSHNYHSKLKGGNGLFVIYWLNWARGYLTKKALKNYVFEFGGTAPYENIDVYKIKVTRPNWDIETLIYINVDDYAIVYMKSSYQNFDQKKPTDNNTWFSKEYTVEVGFRKINNYWHVNKIYDYRHNGLRNDSSIQITRSLYVNNVTLKKLENKHKITPETDLYNYPIAYDPLFWKEYNAPLETEQEKQIKKELERNGVSIQRQFDADQ